MSYQIMFLMAKKYVRRKRLELISHIIKLFKHFDTPSKATTMQP